MFAGDSTDQICIEKRPGATFMTRLPLSQHSRSQVLQIRCRRAGADTDLRRYIMKVLFVWFRRSDLTHDEALAEWTGEGHRSAVRKIPGLKKWTQNVPAELPNATAADGVGELWFATAETMQQGMGSPEMAAAVEDGKRFADMERAYVLVVDEKAVVG
jgi:uncharacterized protein (TIGR02118 family)